MSHCLRLMLLFPLSQCQCCPLKISLPVMSAHGFSQATSLDGSCPCCTAVQMTLYGCRRSSPAWPPMASSMSHVISLGTYWAMIMVHFCLKHTAGNSLQPQAPVITTLAGHHLWDQSPREFKVFQGSPEQSWHDRSDPQQLPDDCMIQDVSSAHGLQRGFHCQSCREKSRNRHLHS